MEQFVARYILEKFNDQQTHGSFDAAVLALDLSGFTALTESFMSHGSAGVENLSEVMNAIFKPIIAEVYEHGGFIAGFSGDALNAVFPSDFFGALVATQEIHKILDANALHETIDGRREVRAKQTLSVGEIEWGVIDPGAGIAKSYYFRGYPVDHAGRMQMYAGPSETIVPEALVRMYRDKLDLEEIDEGVYLLKQLNTGGYKPEPSNYIELSYESVALQFIPEALQQAGIKNEFRHGVSVFINFIDFSGHHELDEFISSLLKVSKEYGGYFSSVEFAEKGNVALFFFGLPVLHEEMIKHALDFSLEVRRLHKTKIKIGAAYGNLFAGAIGSDLRAAYTGIGDSVNLASRVMLTAPDGVIRVAGDLISHAGMYRLKECGEQKFKGKSKPVMVYELDSPTEKSEPANSGFYIGNEQEIDQFLKYLLPLGRGKPSGLFLISGAKGVGKSHFFNTGLSRALEEIQTAPEVCVLPIDSILKKSLNPFNFYFRSRFQIDEESKKGSFLKEIDVIIAKAREHAPGFPGAMAVVDNLDRLKSCLASLLGVYWRGSFFDRLDPQARAENVAIAICDFFYALSMIQPVVLLVRDAQFLDRDSDEVLHRILMHKQNVPLAVVVTCRTENDKEFSPGFIEGVKYKGIVLKELTKEETATQLEALLGQTPGEEFVRYIFDKSHGNPLYSEQMALYLQSSGSIGEKNKNLFLKEEPSSLPDTLSSLLVSRLDRLSSELIHAVKVGSVLGNTLNMEIFQRLLDSDRFEAILKEGVSEKIWSQVNEKEFSFENDLFRQAAYDMQLGKELKELHVAAAKNIHELYGDNPVYYADMAYHYKMASDQRARDYYQMAAAFTRDNYKNYKALEFYNELLNYNPGNEERLEVLYQKSGVLETLGRWQDALAILKGCVAEAAERELTQLQVKLEVKIGEIYQKQGNYPQAAEILDVAIHSLAMISRTPEQDKLLGDAYQWRGRTSWSTGDYNESLLTYEKSLAFYKKCEDKHGEALSLYYIGVDHRDKGNYAKAEKYYGKSLQLFEKLEDRRYISYPLYDLAFIQRNRGEMIKARESFKQVKEIYGEIGYRSGLSAALLNLGILEEKLGNFDLALKKLEESLIIAQELDEKLAISYTLFSIAVVYYLKKEYARSFSYFKNSLELMVQIGAKGYYGYVFSYLTCAYAKVGRYNLVFKTACHHMKNIVEVGSDVEYGRTFLGVAMALALMDPQKNSEKVKRRMERFEKLSGTAPEVEACFQRAIAEAEPAEYIITLLPALRIYGVYLANVKRVDEAREHWNRALGYARKLGIRREEIKLNSLLERSKS